MKMDIDRHGPRLMPNNCKDLNPPYFSLPSTFKRTVWGLLKVWTAAFAALCGFCQKSKMCQPIGKKISRRTVLQRLRIWLQLTWANARNAFCDAKVHTSHLMFMVQNITFSAAFFLTLLNRFWSLSPYPHSLCAQWGNLPCGAEQRIELRPALQQADALHHFLFLDHQICNPFFYFRNVFNSMRCILNESDRNCLLGHCNRLVWKLDRKATKLLMMTFAYGPICYLFYIHYLPYLRMTSWWFLKIVSKMRSGLVGFRWGITMWFQISMQSSFTNKNK